MPAGATGAEPRSEANQQTRDDQQNRSPRNLNDGPRSCDRAVDVRAENEPTDESRPGKALIIYPAEKAGCDAANPRDSPVRQQQQRGGGANECASKQSV